MSEFNVQQVDQIVKEIMPLLERTGMKSSDAEYFMAHFLNRVRSNPLDVLRPIEKVLHNVPLAVFNAKRDDLDSLCLRVADEVRLLIMSGEGASVEEQR